MAPAGAEPRAATSDAGLPTLTTLSAGKTTSVPNAAVDIRRYSARGGIDESKAVPAAYSSVLAAEAGAAAYTPSNDDAIAWAEKQEPRQFARLVDQLQPYFILSAEERTAVGGARALIDLLKGRFSTIFEPGPVKGSIAGFQMRMTVEPVGNLHLERIEMYPVGVERGDPITKCVPEPHNLAVDNRGVGRGGIGAPAQAAAVPGHGRRLLPAPQRGQDGREVSEDEGREQDSGGTPLARGGDLCAPVDVGEGPRPRRVHRTAIRVGRGGGATGVGCERDRGDRHRPGDLRALDRECDGSRRWSPGCVWAKLARSSGWRCPELGLLSPM
jgi:hypothetical protein